MSRLVAGPSRRVLPGGSDARRGEGQRVKIEVLYKSQRFEEFDTSTQVCPEPWKPEGSCVLTDWNLYLGDLDETGVLLVQHWYDGSRKASCGTVTLEGTQVPPAARRVGCAMLLVDPQEVDQLVWLKLDGEKILWREGDDLINGERFFATAQLCYSDDDVRSINRRAIAVFDYLAAANPTLSDDEVAEMMGYTASAIERIRGEELSQEEHYDPDGEENDLDADGIE